MPDANVLAPSTAQRLLGSRWVQGLSRAEVQDRVLVLVVQSTGILLDGILAEPEILARVQRQAPTIAGIRWGLR